MNCEEATATIPSTVERANEGANALFGTVDALFGTADSGEFEPPRLLLHRMLRPLWTVLPTALHSVLYLSRCLPRCVSPTRAALPRCYQEEEEQEQDGAEDPFIKIKCE